MPTTIFYKATESNSKRFYKKYHMTGFLITFSAMNVTASTSSNFHQPKQQKGIFHALSSNRC